MDEDDEGGRFEEAPSESQTPGGDETSRPFLDGVKRAEAPRSPPPFPGQVEGGGKESKKERVGGVGASSGAPLMARAAGQGRGFTQSGLAGKRTGSCPFHIMAGPVSFSDLPKCDTVEKQTRIPGGRGGPGDGR